MKTKSKGSVANGIDEKIFFIIKFWLITTLQGFLMILIVFFLGSINAIGLALIGFGLFVFSVVLTSKFNKTISLIALKLREKLKKYPKIEEMILKSV